MSQRIVVSIIICVVVICLALMTSPSQAANVFEEHFTYTTGNLTSNSGGSWTQTGTNTASPIQVTAGSLSYVGLPSIGGERIRVLSGSNYEDAGRDFTLASFNNGDSVYASFILKVNNAGSAEDYIAHFSSSGSGASDFRTRFFLMDGTTTTKFKLGMKYGNNAAETVQYVGDYDNGTTLYVVISYDKTASNDSARLWINPALNQATPPAADATSVANGSTEVTTPGRFGIRQGSATSDIDCEVDEIRVGTNWQEVTVPVQLSNFSVE